MSNCALNAPSREQARATQHDNFFKQLEGSANGFATVAEYFGRGVMGSEPKRKDI
jgi:hypothetical protein